MIKTVDDFMLFAASICMQHAIFVETKSTRHFGAFISNRQHMRACIWYLVLCIRAIRVECSNYRLPQNRKRGLNIRTAETADKTFELQMSEILFDSY